MNYQQAINKLKRYGFGIVVENGADKEGNVIYYVRRLKSDDDIDKETEDTVIRGRVVAIKTGVMVYTVGGAEDSDNSDKEPKWGV